MPSYPSNPKTRFRPGHFMIGRKDRLGALSLGLMVLVYAVISMPPGVAPTYLARIDSMEKKVKTNYKSATKNRYSVPNTTASRYHPTNSYPGHIDRNGIHYNPNYDPRSNLGAAPPYQPHTKPVPRSDLPAAANTAHQKKYAGKRMALSLNGSDSASLERLPGIGPVLASRIIRYREKLGGFHSKHQLQEVYGIDDTLFAFVEKFIEVSAEDASLKKIDLNTATLETLRQHPYLRWEKARAIIRYREANGPFTSVRDLEKILPLDSTTLLRLLPYVHVNTDASQPP